MNSTSFEDNVTEQTNRVYSIELDWLVDWLVGWVLWHINLCRLFNAKSFLYKSSVLFQTIQFSMSLTVKNISISSYSV